MHIFYSGEPLSDQYTLSEEESKHAVRVLRLKVDDEIIIVDGLGGFYKTVITEDHPKRCKVKITEAKKEYQKPEGNLHIAIAPTKNIERLEWFLEKATEIGINEITPLICENSERDTLKADRLEKVLISAIKQSIKAYLPKLNEPVKFKQFVDNENLLKAKFIAHCYSSPKEPLKELLKGKMDALILIGPEGDFSLKEVSMAEAKGFKSVSLSESRLRTETAALVACCTYHLK
jgi:16S rRNA (uracil1498-N3)-methyltransferase